LAAELLCERWTLLIVSRLIDGCSQFNEIHRGVPRISPSLLSQRLASLEHSGLITRAPAKKGAARRYELTPAGRDLESIIEQLAVWGQHWSRDMTRDDLDPAFLVWSMHTRMNTASMPVGRTVIEFEFTGAPKDLRRFWLVNENGAVDMCLKHPGFEVDVRVESDLLLFVEALRGIRDLRKEILARRIRVTGPSTLRSQFPEWLKLSSLAPYPRRRAGREQHLAQLRTASRCRPSRDSRTSLS
jgi:DNA-binding HxlR family transcriptional regulator